MSLALNFERKCRTCGTDILELTCGIPIFGSGLQLDHKILRYLGLNVSLHDDLPKCLCATCFIKVESIDKFAILAKKTEEAYLGWFKCIRANLAKQYIPLSAAHQRTTTTTMASTSAPGSSPKLDYGMLKQAVSDQISVSCNSPSTAGELQMIKLIKPEVSIISYSDLKLGLLIKDQELLKLILKALKWAEHDHKATFEVLIQRLKNTTFREILSNRNLLNDSDLTQLLKSYVGQEAFNKFTTGTSSDINNLMSSRAATIQPVFQVHSASPSVNTGITKKFKLDDDSVTQMEVGVDPSLYLDDEESQNRFKHERQRKPENVVTIQLVPANLANKSCNEKMIPAILKCDVRSHGSFLCTNCPLTFNTNSDLQQHIVTSHLISSKKLCAENIGDKKVIKIRVKKNKINAETVAPKPPDGNIPQSIPISIPPTTTITVIPSVTRPVESKSTEPMSSNVKDLEKPPKPERCDNPAGSMKNLEKASTPPKALNKPKKKPERKITIKLDQILSKRTRSQLNRRSKLTCTICKRRHTTKSDLKAHMESHTKSKGKYTCEKCDRVFKTSINLSRHRQYHAGESFSCDRCRRVYPTSSTLRAHKITHSDARPHKCSICSKTFKRSQDLKFHLNQHTGARPYKCPHCPKSFASSGNCFSHRKRMHDIETSACTVKEKLDTRSSRTFKNSTKPI
ncbi:zinc finger protein with KRAB and SCAN domains 7-like [Topomyia yanbarensis]|uniref:zinc finger protein with KRAB and SCAN domains 7-like n=1 Tax=Topomyia yanbarensis TaxID=2498891 RepID=UPI00273CA84F|nr:zinc finger protein with KRAB and SCAN domains 7-like [Topomyia yanbarensis]